jgi:prepilin peptidase CpaA
VAGGPRCPLAYFYEPSRAHIIVNELSLIYTNFALVILGFMLLFATVTDVIAHRIPNALLAPALAIALLIGVNAAGLSGLLAAISGLIVGMMMLLPLYVAGGTAAGDVKLLGVAGAFLGPSGALFAGLFTFIAGAVFGLAFIALRVILPKLQYWQAESSIPLFNHTATRNTTNGKGGNSFAYAPAIMVGSIAAAWYEGWTFLGV